MPEGVIDLTAEDGDDLEQPAYAYTTIHHPQQRQPARPIDLTDESDDIEYIGVNRLHLPARHYATGNDPRQPHFNRNVDIANPNAPPGRRRAILNSVVREAEAREGIFSRDAGNAGPGPAAEAFAAARGHQQPQPARRVPGHVPPPRADPHGRARYQGIFNDVREYGFDDLDDIAGIIGGQGNNHNANHEGAGGGFLNQWFRGAIRRLPFFGGPGAGFGMPAFNFHHGGQPYVPIPNDAEAKRKRKRYSVRQSHPGFTKQNSKGFSRDVIPPPEYEPEPESEQEELASKAAKVEELKEEEEILPTISSRSKGKQKMQVFDISESSSGTDSPKVEIDDDETDEEKPLMSIITKPSPKRLDKGKQRAVDQDNLDAPTFDLDTSSTSSSGTSTENSLDKPESSSTSSTSIEMLPSASSSKVISSAPLAKTESSSSSSVEIIQPSKAVPLPSTPKVKTRTVPCPVCASCAQPLYLNQPSKKRPYLLFCQHVVCHTCLMAATKRCEEWSKRKKEGGWTGTPVEEFEELEPASIPVPDYGSRGKESAAGDNKGKRKREDNDEGEDELEGTASGKKQRKTGKSAKTRTSRSKRAAAAVANARDFAESSGEEDIAVPDDPSYRPPERDGEEGQVEGSQAKQEVEDDDEMNDGPRQPGTSYTTIASSPDKKAPKARKGAKGKQAASAAAKKKKEDSAGEIQVDENWLVCPIEACKGHKTDLLQPIGSKTGAWEMFV